MSAVEISNVTKTFRSVCAIDQLSLSVPLGAVYGFIGPNGSGKSTTMRMIANILYPDSGTISVFGQQRAGTRSGDIGYLPEERGLYRKMRVRDLLEFHGELRGGRNVGTEVNAWLERLGLAHCAERKVETLSKGMSQKIQFIATVVPEPKLLILDEPTEGIQPNIVHEIGDIILRLNKEEGLTVLLVEQKLPFARRVASEFCILDKGRRAAAGPIEELTDEIVRQHLSV